MVPQAPIWPRPHTSTAPSFHTLNHFPLAAPGRVYDATAMALYGCCRQRYAYSRQLCGIGAPATGHNTPTAGPASSTDPGTTAAASAAAAARQVWVQLLRGFLEGEVQAGGSSAGGAGAGAGAGPGGGPHAGARLLCSCVALRQGLLEPLLGLLDGEPGPDGGSSTAAAAAGARAGQAVTGTCEAATPRVSGFGRYGPVLLHVLAQELYDMRPGVAVHVGYDSSSTADADSSGSGGGMRQGGQQEGPAAGHAAACGPPQLVQMRHVAGRPLASALLHVARLAEAAARECASAGAGAGAGVSAGQSAPPAEAAGGGSGAGGGAGGVAGEASEGWAPAAAVLEAALEVGVALPICRKRGQQHTWTMVHVLVGDGTTGSGARRRCEPDCCLRAALWKAQTPLFLPVKPPRHHLFGRPPPPSARCSSR